MKKTYFEELVARQKKYPLVATINSILVDGQVDLLKFSEEQIAQMEADLLLKRNAAQQKQTPLKPMNRLAVFVFFFILAWFVPAWPLLLVIGVIWLVAKFQSGGGKEPRRMRVARISLNRLPLAGAVSDGRHFRGLREESRNRFFAERKGEIGA